MMKKLMKEYKKFALIFTIVFTGFVFYNITLSYAETKTAEKFFNPYKRTKHGPPLKNVTHKVNKEWLFDWIKNPKDYDPNSRMPNLLLEDDEVKSIMAYLASVADKDFPKAKWDAFLTKAEAELTDEEFDAVDKLIASGKGVWGMARCNLCHAQKGIGGYVTVAPDLGKLAAKKINRDWLYLWLKNPRDHFPNTMMPQYRLLEEEARPLIEYLLRSYDFVPEEKEEEEEAEESEEEAPTVEITYSNDTAVIEEGKRIITVSRCVVCHDVEGIDEVLPVEEQPIPTEGFPKLVYEIRCLTCHNFFGEGGTYAPELTFRGSEVKGDWIVDFLQAPDIIRPILQQMPKFNLSEEEAKIAADYIKKNFVSEIQAGLFTETTVNKEKAEAGKAFFYDYGCNACHAVGAVGGVIGPNLDSAGDRLEPNSMYAHLKDPRHADPGDLDSAEPDYKLTDEEITNLVHFLMTLTKKGTS